MSQAQTLRVFVNQRLTAAAEEIFELFERSIAKYEQQLSRSKEENERQQKLLDSVLSPRVRIQKSACTADVQQLLVSREQAPVRQEWSPRLDQEDAEPPLIKEEDGQGEDYTPKFTFIPVSLKSEDDEENHQSSEFYQFPTGQMKTGANWEDFGPEQTRNINQGGHLQPVIAVKTEDSSELVAEVSDNKAKEISKHQSGLHSNDINKIPVKPKSLSTGSLEKPFVCGVCGKRMGYSGHLITHMRTHTGEKPFSCSICAKRFTQKCSLTQHMVLHTGEKPFSCTVCNQRFSWRSQIKRHECIADRASELLQSQTEEKGEAETEAGGEESKGTGQAWNSDPNSHLQPEIEVKIEDSSESEGDDKDEDWKETKEDQSDVHSPDNEVSVSYRSRKTVKKPFSCSECDKRFTCQKNLKKHMKSHTGEKLYHCSVCDKRFSHKETLVRHSKFHSGEKPYSCSVCSKDFSRKENFARHMRFHSGEKPFRCSFCNKHFTRQDHAVTHMRTHTGEKPYSCSECGKKMSCRTSLRVHMRIHTGERPFSCSFCCKRFTQRGSLTEHMALHTGDKSFDCSECGKRTSSKSSLKVHMRLHTGERPFSCSVCGKDFTQKGNLAEHMAVHNGEKLFSCNICDKHFSKKSQLKGHKCVSDSSESDSAETISSGKNQVQSSVEQPCLKLKHQ